MGLRQLAMTLIGRRVRRRELRRSLVVEWGSAIPDIMKSEDVGYIWSRLRKDTRFYLKGPLRLSGFRRPAGADDSLCEDVVRDSIAYARSWHGGPRVPFAILKPKHNVVQRVYAVAAVTAEQVLVAEWLEPTVLRDILRLMCIRQRKSLRRGETLHLLFKEVDTVGSPELKRRLSKEALSVIHMRLMEIDPSFVFVGFDANRAQGLFLLNELLATVNSLTSKMSTAGLPVARPLGIAKPGSWRALGGMMLLKYPGIFQQDPSPEDRGFSTNN